MPSKVLRRSGISMIAIAEWLEWKPDLVVQVGIGLYHQEVNVMRQAWPDVRFIGFEPNKKIFKGLDDYPGEVYKVAIGNKAGKSVLWNKPGHKDGSSLFKHRSDGRCNEMPVQITTLDSVLNEPIEDQVLLWLDCEGSELMALQGAKNFIRSVDAVNVELTGNPTNEGWACQNDVHKYLNDCGFFRVWIHTQRSRMGQYDCVYVRHGLFRPEQCCCPCQIDKWKEWKLCN